MAALPTTCRRWCAAAALAAGLCKRQWTVRPYDRPLGSVASLLLHLTTPSGKEAGRKRRGDTVCQRWRATRTSNRTREVSLAPDRSRNCSKARKPANSGSKRSRQQPLCSASRLPRLLQPNSQASKAIADHAWLVTAAPFVPHGSPSRSAPPSRAALQPSIRLLLLSPDHGGERAVNGASGRASQLQRFGPSLWRQPERTGLRQRFTSRC